MVIFIFDILILFSKGFKTNIEKDIVGDTSGDFKYLLIGILQGNRSEEQEIPYLPYIFGRIKIIIFFTVRTFNLEKNYKFFSVRIFTNAEKLPNIEGIHRYICGNFSVYTDRCENKQFV